MSQQPAPTLATLQIIGAGIVFSTLIMTGMSLGVVWAGIAPSGGEPVDDVVVYALAAAGIGAAFLSFAIRRALPPPSLDAAGQIAPQQAGRVILPLALAETAAPLGLVAALLSGQTTLPLFLCVVALSAAIFHFPTRAMLSGKGRE